MVVATVQHVKGKTASVSCLVGYPLNQPELKKWSRGFIGIDIYRHSADARRQGWIDLNMKTTTDCHFLHSSNKENSQNKRADLDSNFFGSAMVTIKSLYKLALHKILLHGAFA